MSADTRSRWPEIPSIPVESPFPTGRLKFHEKDTGWSVKNDGVLITLIQDNDNHRDLSSLDSKVPLRRSIESIVQEFPVMGNIVSYKLGGLKTTKEGMHRVPTICTIPTVATLNALSRDVFDGLPTAGIEIMQSRTEFEEVDGETPAALYVDNLMQRRLVASSDPDLYLHDILFHGLGAMTTKKSEFEIFQALGQERDQIDDDVRASYTARLGLIFDLYTFLAPPPHTKNLPEYCLHILGYDYSHLASTGDSISVTLPEAVLRRSQQIIEPYLTKNSNGRARSTYYEEIDRRVKQDPWQPPNYTPPLLTY